MSDARSFAASATALGFRRIAHMPTAVARAVDQSHRRSPAFSRSTPSAGGERQIFFPEDIEDTAWVMVPFARLSCGALL